MRRRSGSLRPRNFGSRNRCGDWRRSGRAPRPGRADRRFSGPRARPDRFEFRPGRAASGRLVGRGGREHPRRLGCGRGTAGGGGRGLRPDARDCADRRRGELVLDSIQLWNEKRATAQVSAFSAANDVRCPLANDRQSAFGRLARLQAAMDRSPPARNVRSRDDAADAEGLHQFPADPPARHGRI
jgi:hypothetical protein